MCPENQIEGLKESLEFLEDMEFLGIKGLEEILSQLDDLEEVGQGCLRT